MRGGDLIHPARPARENLAASLGRDLLEKIQLPALCVLAEKDIAASLGRDQQKRSTHTLTEDDKSSSQQLCG